MNDSTNRTGPRCTHKPVPVAAQNLRWIEFQLLDEQGEPLANLPWRAKSEASRQQCASEYAGQTDAQGVLRLEGLYPTPITLLMAADPLAQVLQTRRLRTIRPEPAMPGAGDGASPYGPQRPGFSPIEQQAHAAGHAWHYMRIGQLCDRLPAIDPPLPDPEQPPAYHFPDPSYGGFTVSDEQFNRRHVLEVCPLRAWSLILHHQPDYSLANAYNLALMSNLAYGTWPKGLRGSVLEFFERQCLDLSRTPQVWDGKASEYCLVRDVPFSERYTEYKALDTSRAEPPQGHTQLFYAISASQVLVAWRGTEFNSWDLPDVVTDLTLRPVRPEVEANCAPSVPCADLTEDGKVHLGFREGFEVARRAFAEQLGRTIPDQAFNRQLFICGHSLGGALGLIHAAALKDKNPLLYTYGMPRTFTLKAVQCLDKIKHFRHVNDTDTVASVPPEADLDNHLYRLYGPLGTIMGFAWSVGQTLASTLYKFGDPFCHHGEIAAFHRAAQHTLSRGSSYAAYRSKDGLGAPYYNTITTRLPHRPKLFLVPSLSKEDARQSAEAQSGFMHSLDTQTRERYFPRYGNSKTGGVMGGANHLLGGYQSYLRNCLLELHDPQRQPLLKEQLTRQKFVEQMAQHAQNTPTDEHQRNRLFLQLHDRVGEALQVTHSIEGGKEALLRFNALAASLVQDN